MTDTEKVHQLYSVVFGVEGQGGLLREVEDLKMKVASQDKRLNSISIKWLLLTALIGTLGNALGQTLPGWADFAQHLLK